MPMKKQEMFTKIATHMLTQRSTALRPYSAKCAYRGDDGKKCAIGCIITDATYSPDLEGAMVASSKVTAAVQKSIGRRLGEREFIALEECQHIHDDVSPSLWEERLRHLYEHEGIKWEVPEEVVAEYRETMKEVA